MTPFEIVLWCTAVLAAAALGVVYRMIAPPSGSGLSTTRWSPWW